MGRRKTSTNSSVLMPKKPFSGDLSSLPNSLRCRRSDGKKWRCPQPAKSGLSYCEYHYEQMRRNQDSQKNTFVRAESSVKSKRRLLPTVDPPLKKRRRRKRQRKNPTVAEPIESDTMIEEAVEMAPSDEKLSMNLHSPLWTHQPDDREWHCSSSAMPDLSSDRCCIHRKDSSEEINKVIESMPKRKARRAANLLPPITALRTRRPRISQEEGTVRMGPRKDGECEMVVAEPSVTKLLPILDLPRCRHSDGRKWRCGKPVITGITFCDYHLMRCKQTYKKSTKVSIAKPDKRSILVGEDLTREGQNEEVLETAKLATADFNLCPKDLLCCRGHNNTTNASEQAILNAEAAMPATPDVDASEPATLDMGDAEPVSSDLCLPDNHLLCRTEDIDRIKEASSKRNRSVYLPSDPQPSKKNLSLSDHLRCRRSDGRKWRCSQLAMPSVGFCEYHFLQMRRNQGKLKNKLAATAKRKWGMHLGANRRTGRKLRQPRARRELSGEDLTRANQKERVERLEAADLEITRDLPNGVMAISPGAAWGQGNASSSVDWKLGSGDGHLLGRLFRSKNAERVPLAKIQKLPFFRSMGGCRNRVFSSLQGQGD